MTNYVCTSLLLLTLALVSCGDSATDEVVEQPAEPREELSLDQRIERHVKAELEILSTEKYSMKIYREQLNYDGLEDAIITVNLLDRAIQKATQGGTVSKAAEIEFFGNYNCFFFYNSETDEISPVIYVASTPLRELKVSFEHISSPNYKDLLIDYPVRNSEFRRYYPVIGKYPTYVFQWKVYDGWGTNETEAYCFGYDQGTYSEFRDILIYQATLKNIPPEADYNKEEPEITCADQLVHRFFYNPKDRKYYTDKK